MILWISWILCFFGLYILLLSTLSLLSIEKVFRIHTTGKYSSIRPWLVMLHFFTSQLNGFTPSQKSNQELNSSSQKQTNKKLDRAAVLLIDPLSGNSTTRQHPPICNPTLYRNFWTNHAFSIILVYDVIKRANFVRSLNLKALTISKWPHFKALIGRP